MKRFRQMLALLLCLFLTPAWALAEEYLPLQDAHRVKMTQLGEQLNNGASVYRWQIETAHPQVSDELNALAKAYADELAPTLERPAKNGSSRLDVSIRHSRTGLTWMSFMVQSRYVFDKDTRDVRFTTRTYDMVSGKPVGLTDIFPADSSAWDMMESALRERINTYYPDLTPNAEAYGKACTRAAIEQMDFTLHGMSLVLHLHAADFYPGKEQLIEVPLYYPEIRPHMTEKARIETDNLTYYQTVALTYDDGPTAGITQKMLNVLLETGERATFFLVGDRMRGYPQYILREHDEGHAIASHNYKHVYANQTSAEKLTPLLARVKEVHLEILGLEPTYMRAPGGQWQGLAKLDFGYPLIQWSADANDWEGENGRAPDLVVAGILYQTKNGGIILMHDLKRNSITASKSFIPALQERGFIFLTVDELFAKDGVKLEPNTPYWRCANGQTER